MKFASKLFTCALVVALLPAVCSAQNLFEDQMNDGADWDVNSSGVNANNFDYDYSADGIPEAPNPVSGGAATRGVKLRSNLNQANPASSFFTLYPKDGAGAPLNFTGDLQLRFDAWMNFSNSGAGTTEFLGGGLGYDNVTADIASGAQLMFTGEGGSSNDWRAFKSPTVLQQFFIQDAEMTAGTHQGTDPHYADFLPAVAPPASQGQAGTSAAGSPGFQWITVEMNSVGDNFSIWIEKPDLSRLEIVSYSKSDVSDGSAGVSTDGNISIFYADFFSSFGTDGDNQFGIVDNVYVNRAVPEPASATMFALALGLAAIGRRRR